MDDATTAFSRAGSSILRLVNLLSAKLGLHQSSRPHQPSQVEIDAWNNAVKGAGRGGISSGGTRATNLPAAPGAGNAAGATKLKCLQKLKLATAGLRLDFPTELGYA